jgi:hypothetical protein
LEVSVETGGKRGSDQAILPAGFQLSDMKSGFSWKFRQNQAEREAQKSDFAENFQPNDMKSGLSWKLQRNQAEREAQIRRFCRQGSNRMT